MNEKTPLRTRIERSLESPVGRRNKWFVVIFSIVCGPVAAIVLGRYGYPLLGVEPVTGWFCGSCAQAADSGVFSVRSPIGCLLSVALITGVVMLVLAASWVMGYARMSERKYQKTLAWRPRKWFRRDGSK